MPLQASRQTAATLTSHATHGADAGEACWLLDAIVIAQRFDVPVAVKVFQVGARAIRPARTATRTCEEGNGHAGLTKPIEETDFPRNAIWQFFTNHVMYLPIAHGASSPRRVALARICPVATLTKSAQSLFSQVMTPIRLGQPANIVQSASCSSSAMRTCTHALAESLSLARLTLY